MRTKAIFGLGNPGARYADTRHNAGFLVVDRLALRHGIALDRHAATAVWGEGRVAGAAVRLIKPTRFMNRSGEAVHELLAEGGGSSDDLLVVHDELDLPFGRLKLKAGGGTAGHRGLASMQEELGDAGFARLRLGIGRPQAEGDVSEHVLGPFLEAERERLPELLERAAAACEAWLEHGIGPAMNRVNAAAGAGAGSAAASGDPAREPGAASEAERPRAK